MKETMGQIIKRLRKERGFTQEELAEQIGVTFQAVSKWENDTGMPDISQVIPLATVFDVSTDELFGLYGTNNAEEVKKIIEEACSFLSYPVTKEMMRKKYDRLHEGLELYPNNTALLMNCLETAPLDEVRALKMDYCQAVYDGNGIPVTRTANYRKFVRDIGAWLRPYAAQCLLKRINGTSDSAAWGNYSRYSLEQLERFLKARHREASFIFYLQYQLRQQLLTVARFARTKKIALFCDMNDPRHVKYLDAKEPWVNQRFIEQRLRESGRMAIVPLRDWLLIDGDYLKRLVKCSSQRLPVSLEELVADHEFITRVKSIMAPEKRTP